MPKEKKPEKPAVSVASDADAAIAAALGEINKRHGEGTISYVGSGPRLKHPCIPTGIYQLDNFVIQAGGVPRRRFTEIYGPESGGKTTLALSAIAEAQRLGGRAAFIDAEHALDGDYAGDIGVKVKDLLVCQPDNGEQALEVAEQLVRSGALDIIVVDSVATLVPKAELAGEIGDSHVGLQARLMSQACRILTPLIGSTDTALVFINQIRDKVGVMYGNPETTPGGKALRFAASVRLDVRRIGPNNTVGAEAISNTVKIKAVKNKIGSPYREALVDIVYGKGFDKVGSIVDAAVANGVIAKSGSWLTVEGERYQGKEQVTTLLTVTPDLYRRVYDAVLAKDAEGAAA